MRDVTRQSCAALLAALLAGLVAACGGDGETQDFEAGPLGAVEIGTGEAIHIRSMLPLGPEEEIGAPMRRSIEMAVRDFGDIRGRRVELGEPIDSMCSGAGGKAGALQITADPQQIVGVIGPACSEAAVTASPLISGAGLVMISPSNTSPRLTSDLAGNPNPDHYPGYFRTANNGICEAKAVADFVYHRLGLRRMATVHDGDADNSGLVVAFNTAFRALGGRTVDVHRLVTAAMDGCPDTGLCAPPEPPGGVFVSLSEAGDFHRFFHELEILSPGTLYEILANATIITSSALLIPAFLANTPPWPWLWPLDIYLAGPEPVDDANVNEATGKSRAEVLAAYQAMYGEPETLSWVHAYDATTLLLSGIDSVVSEVGGRLYVDRAALREAIAETDNFEGLVGMLSCDDFGDCGTGRVNIYHHADPSITDPAQLPVVYSFAPPPPVHAVELPGDHGLGNWLENHLDRNDPGTTSASFIVPAGQYRDAGGVRFSCPSGGADCEVTVMRGCFEFVVTSTGGRASAENNLVKLPDGARALWAFAGDSLAVPAGQYRDVSDVRFSCPSDGAECEVTFVYSYCIPIVCPEDATPDAVSAEICADRIPGVVSLGGAATADLVALQGT